MWQICVKLRYNHIRALPTEDMAIAVAVSMVHSRLDYAKSVIQVRQTLRDCSLYKILLPELFWKKNSPSLSSS